MLLALFISGVTITLQPAAQVKGTEVRLDAIATVEGDDAAEVARVRALGLGYAPAPGYSRLIATGRVSSDVARMFPGLTVTLKGADACRVAPAIERVSGEALEAAAKAEVLRWLDGRDVELTRLAAIADVEVPAGDKPFEVRAVLGESALKGGPINVPVRVMVDGNLYRTIWTNWQLAIWEVASVPKCPILAGETITLDMLEKKRVLSAIAGPETALAAGLVVGSTARRDLAPGTPVREMDVVRPVLVRRGDSLFLEVRRGGVQARVAGIAEQDARAGERIDVTLLDSKRKLSATVVSRELARIDFDGNG
jgi:flagella basal body P-ring formation protein FlgA